MRNRYLYGEKTIYYDDVVILLKYYILDKEMDSVTGYEQWGIEVESHTKGKVYTERINYLYKDYKKVRDIIYILFKNEVTTVSFYEVLNELYDNVI